MEDGQELGQLDGHELDVTDQTAKNQSPATGPYLTHLLSQIRPEQLHVETDWGDPQGLEEW